jgi:predicted ribosome quality control (RQC) complex YloA/Tae2 family protein
MKTRFDGLDVTAMVGHLHTAFLDRRVLNVYDGGDAETYIIKFDKGIEEGKGSSAAAGGDPSSRGFVLIESGKRFHPLDHFQSEASVMPSPFAAKLRKHLKGLRVNRIFQVGRDRVVVFSFSSFHLILELYDRGNVILCDSSYTIIALLRSHVYVNKPSQDSEAPTGAGDKPLSAGVAVQVGHVYPVSYATKASDQPECVGILADDFLPWVQEQLANSSHRRKKKNALTLKTLVLQSNSGVSHYGPALLEHCILTASLDPHETIVDEAMLHSIEWPLIRSVLSEEGQRIFDSLKKGSAKGFIRYTESSISAGEESGEAPPAMRLFQEYLPCLFSQHSNALILEYGTFGDAVQDFYQQLVEQKASQRTNQLERAAHDKLQKIRLDQEARVTALQDEQEQLQLQAQLLQQHASSVDAALTVVNSALNSGMDWVQLSQLVQVEQSAGNRIACLIHSLDLERDAMTLNLPQPDDETEKVLVTVSLRETAHSNASILFSRYRAAKEKTAKTVDSMGQALKAAEANAKRQIESAQKRLKSSNAAAVAAGGQRKPAWFEKFHWFITSDNYLVLGGKDAHQNELLVKRYLRPGDAYLHADVFGSTSTILRAKRQRTAEGKTKPIPLPDQALREAGNFTICRSSAWSSRMVTSAWWVESHQVSKTAPTGEYLTVGSFMIRGKKNFLPPASLEMVSFFCVPGAKRRAESSLFISRTPPFEYRSLLASPGTCGTLPTRRRRERRKTQQ